MKIRKPASTYANAGGASVERILRGRKPNNSRAEARRARAAVAAHHSSLEEQAWLLKHPKIVAGRMAHKRALEAAVGKA